MKKLWELLENHPIQITFNHTNVNIPFAQWSHLSSKVFKYKAVRCFNNFLHRRGKVNCFYPGKGKKVSDALSESLAVWPSCALPLQPSAPSAAARQRGAPVLQQEPSPGHRDCLAFHWSQSRHRRGTQTACPSPKTWLFSRNVQILHKSVFAATLTILCLCNILI